MSTGSFFRPYSMMRASAAASSRRICAAMEIRAFPADAVILATGGPGIIFGKSTNSVINTGTAASAVYQQGAYYANGEFIQIHPTAIPGDDKLRLMSESARGEGGRVWTYKDGKPWYFLEEIVSRLRQPGAAGHRYPGDLPSVRRSEAGHQRRKHGVSRPLPQGSEGTGRQTGRNYRDLREVHGRRPAEGADEDLPGGSLFDGRSCGSTTTT